MTVLCRFLLVVLTFSPVAVALEKPLLISDFDQTVPAQKWMKSGNVILKLSDTSQSQIKEISGNALNVTFEDKKSFIYSPSSLFNSELKSYDHVTFWLHKQDEGDVVFEFQIMDKSNTSRFWRKVTVSHKGWKKITLPLRWFRWAGKISPSWNEISRIAFFPRAKCSFVVDQIQFEDLDGKAGLFVNSAEDISKNLLPDSDPKSYEKDFLIVSENKKVDVQKLGEHFEKVLNEIYLKVPSLKREKNEAKPYLVIVNDGEGFKKALGKFGELQVSQVPGTELSGYSMMNSAFSSYSEKYGTMRPVYLHEFMHAVMATQGRILKSHNWVHEGFANYIQMKYQPQKGLGKIILQSMNREGLNNHILKLTENDDIQFKDYVYVLMIAETLWECEKYSTKIGQFFEYVENSGDTNFKEILKKIYQKSFDEFMADLKEFLAAKHSRN